MIIRSKAPLRIGLAGGGSDVSPYCDIYGGLILNATINLYAHCTIEETKTNEITIVSADLKQKVTYPVSKLLPIDNRLDLIKSVYNRIMKDFNIKTVPSFVLTTYSDVPPGSGLGSSSTLVVAVLKAFVEWFNLPLGEYEIANLAYQIERVDMGLSGGKQDQYAATFGGFNFMEFLPDNRVIVNPLRIKRWIVDELEASIVLFYLGASRFSAKIIEEQRKNTEMENNIAIHAMHKIKQSAIDFKEAILAGNISKIAKIVGESWEEKKKMATSITNSTIENIYNIGIKNGALSGKVTGAGGGGFIFFIVDPTKKINLINALNGEKGRVFNVMFIQDGCHGWKIY